MSETDATLLERWVRRHDAAAFNALALRHAGMVYGTCRRVLNNPSEAEDAAQECFEILAQAGVRPGAYLGAWLHRVATNQCLRRIKQDARRRAREQRFAAETAPTSEIGWDDVYGYVDEAIAALPERFRLPLVAHFLNGQTHDSIAQQMGLSRQTVTYRIGKGIEQIRRSLKWRGVVLTSAALFAFLKADVAEAAPATLFARLGKLALAGPVKLAPAVAAPAALQWLSHAKLWIACVCVAAVGVAGYWIVERANVATKSATPIGKTVKAATTPPAATASGTAPVKAAPAAEDAGVSPPIFGEADDGKGDSALLCQAIFPDGSPAAGAPIRVVRYDERQWRTGVLRPRGTVVANQEGTAVFDGLPEGGYVACARTPGAFAITEQTISVSACSWGVATLALRPITTLEGRVADAAGVGIAGAAIYPAAVSASSGLIMKLARVFVPRAVEGDIREAQAASASVSTDASGAFSIPLWQGLSWKLHAKAEGYATAATGWVSPGTPVEIALSRGATLRGKAVHAETGNAVPGIPVLLTSDDTREDRWSALTDTQGQYRFQGLRAGDYAQAIEDDEWIVTASSELVKLAEDQDAEVTLEITPGAIVSGRVTEAKSGQAVAGAEITLARNERVQRPRKKIVTDASGAYRVTGLRAGSMLFLYAQKGYLEPENAPRIEVTAGPGQEQTGADFTLTSARDGRAQVSGTIVDPSGKPLPNVYVRAHTGAFGSSAHARSDQDGRFVLDGLMVTRDLEVSAARPGLASKPLESLSVTTEGLHDVVLEMLATGSISGTVVDAEGHLCGLVQGQIDASTPGHFLPSAPIGEQGAFRFPDVPAGTCQLFVNPEPNVMYGGIRMPNATIEVAPGQRVTGVSLNFDVKGWQKRMADLSAQEDDRSGRWRIEGQVIRADSGKPVPEFTLNVHDLGISHGQHQDKDGKFQSDDLQQPQVVVQIAAPGCAPKSETVLASSAVGGAAHIVIRMDRGEIVEGEVVNASGSPVAGARIYVGKLPDRTDRDREGALLTGNDGAFRVDTLTPEPTRIYADHPEHAIGAADVVPVRGAVTPMQIVLTEGGTIEGVIRSEGKPIRGAGFVYGLEIERNDSNSLKTDEQGHYVAQHVMPGVVRLTAQLPMQSQTFDRMRWMKREVTVREGETVRADFDFAPATGRVEGVITIGGQPPTQASVGVEIRDAGGTQEIHGTAPDAEGHYQTESLPAGEVSVRISATSSAETWLNRTFTLTVAEGEVVRQDVDFAGTCGISGSIHPSDLPGSTNVFALEGNKTPPADPRKWYETAVAHSWVRDGVYRLEPLPAGRYFIGALNETADPRAIRTGSAEISLAPDEQKTLDIDLGEAFDP